MGQKSDKHPDPSLEGKHAWLSGRWEQLGESLTTFGEEGIKYLLFVNMGAMAASLSFIGAMPHIRQAAWPTAVLSLFAVGVVFLAFYHLARVCRTEWAFSCFRKNYTDYMSGALLWNDLLSADEGRWKRYNAPLFICALGSLICFLAGMAVAAWNFHDVTRAPPKEVANERTQDTTVTTTTTTITNTGKASPDATGHPRSAEQPAPAARSDAPTEPVRVGVAAGQRDRREDFTPALAFQHPSGLDHCVPGDQVPH